MCLCIYQHAPHIAPIDLQPGFTTTTTSTNTNPTAAAVATHTYAHTYIGFRRCPQALLNGTCQPHSHLRPVSQWV